MTLLPSGADFSVYSPRASGVEICLFEEGDALGESERRIPLTERAYGWWYARLPGVSAGQRYGLRAHGPWEPSQGLRFNPQKLLVDPYARGIEGEVTVRPEIFGHAVDDRLQGDGEIPSASDSRAFVPRSVAVHNGFDWGESVKPLHSFTETVIYEVHVKNATALHPGIPPELRGTYAGLAHPVMIDYYHRLGITTLELLPVHAFTSEPAVARRGLTNHWGYNTLGFFAPHLPYAASQDPQEALDEFKGMVKLLHLAGIEVVLDVVYNHTAEASAYSGPMLSLRGLASEVYYRLDARGVDIDMTGCGNSVNLRHPLAAQLVLDSMRYWVEQCQIDGFRMDLAVTLARGKDDQYDREHPFLIALRTDPVLSTSKLIAEPWDVGPNGWRTGQFPPPIAEWNDRYRDTMRSFWLSDVAAAMAGKAGHRVREVATRLAGSEDLFAAFDRGPIASINFVTAHDGFTLADLTAYNSKHNEANGEGNRDGSPDNHSWNHGAEGWADASEDVAAWRRRSMRNLLATLLLSAGVPMLNGGDEFGRTQAGNNNAYCQDNEISWFSWDWEPWQQDLADTTAFLVRLRQAHRSLRQRRFFSGWQLPDGRTDIAWYNARGEPMTPEVWLDHAVHTLTMWLDGSWLGESSLLVVFHSGAAPTEVVLPEGAGARHGYVLVWDSAWERPHEAPAEPVLVEPGPVRLAPASMRVYRTVETSSGG